MSPYGPEKGDTRAYAPTSGSVLARRPSGRRGDLEQFSRLRLFLRFWIASSQGPRNDGASSVLALNGTRAGTAPRRRPFSLRAAGSAGQKRAILKFRKHIVCLQSLTSLNRQSRLSRAHRVESSPVAACYDALSAGGRIFQPNTDGLVSSRAGGNPCLCSKFRPLDKRSHAPASAVTSEIFTISFHQLSELLHAEK